MRAIIAIAMLALSGCSTVLIPYPDSIYKWKKVREPLPYTMHIIPQQAVDSYCSSAKSKAYACAVWDHEECWIFASSEWNMMINKEHEIEHCLGKDHQNV